MLYIDNRFSLIVKIILRNKNAASLINLFPVKITNSIIKC